MLRAAISERRARARFPRSAIHRGASVSRDSTIGDFAVLFPGASLDGSTLGRYSYVQRDSVLVNADIGPFCSIAGDVTVGLAGHPITMVSTSPVFYDPRQPLPRFLVDSPFYTEGLPRTAVGADVWIGQGAMVKAGIRVGTGAVLGAGTVVTKDVEPYAVVAGVPARLMRLRFPDEMCRRLIESRWWELDDATLRRLAPHFQSPEHFLAAYKSLNRETK